MDYPEFYKEELEKRKKNIYKDNIYIIKDWNMWMVGVIDENDIYHDAFCYYTRRDARFNVDKGLFQHQMAHDYTIQKMIFDALIPDEEERKKEYDEEVKNYKHWLMEE